MSAEVPTVILNSFKEYVSEVKKRLEEKGMSKTDISYILNGSNSKKKGQPKSQLKKKVKVEETDSSDSDDSLLESSGSEAEDSSDVKEVVMVRDRNRFVFPDVPDNLLKGCKFTKQQSIKFNKKERIEWTAALSSKDKLEDFFKKKGIQVKTVGLKEYFKPNPKTKKISKIEEIDTSEDSSSESEQTVEDSTEDVKCVKFKNYSFDLKTKSGSSTTVKVSKDLYWASADGKIYLWVDNDKINDDSLKSTSSDGGHYIPLGKPIGKAPVCLSKIKKTGDLSDRHRAVFKHLKKEDFEQNELKYIYSFLK